MTDPLKIYSGSNALLYTTPVNIGCRRRVQLMIEDSITVKFSDKSKMKFPVGTRIGDFYITKEQQEKYNATTGGYDYELKFDAYYWLWANRLLFYVMPGVTNAPKETSFKLTATIDVHAAVILRALNTLGFTYDGSPFRVDTDAGFSTEAKYISYANMSILGGIQAIADAYECEWWVVGNAIHFGKCNAIGEYDFTVGENVVSITSDAKTTPANRLVVFGSTRNLPPNYRTQESSDVVDAVVVKRLMLPEDTPYLQTSPDIPENEIVEEEIVLESVYPRTSLSVTDVETYESTTEGVTQTFYRVKYGTTFHFSKDYILPEEELHVVFESGNLNGMDFAVKFNPLGLAEKKDDGSINPDAQMFEIVANEDYGRSLPDAVLHPSKTDKFSLYGWDSTKMEDLGLLDAAEQELLDEAEKLLDEYRKDKQTYTCPMMWDWCKAQADEGNSPRLGSVVNLHFVAGDAGRKSRIIGFEHDLDIEYSNVTYICGEKVSVSRLKTLESKVEGLTHTGEKVKVQNSLDFLSKRYSDRTPYGLSVGGTLTAEDLLQSRQFIAGLMGWRIDQKGNMEVESGVFRSFAQFAELIVNRLTAVEGDQIMTEGDTIETVTDNGDGSYTLKLHEKWDGYFTAQIEHNVIKGIYNNITQGLTPGEGQQTVNNAMYYTSWMNVISVDPANNEITVILYPDEETPAGKNFQPEPMMKIARWGNSGDSEDPRYLQRQQCLYLSSTEGRVVKLFRVTKPIIDAGNIAASFGTFPEFLSEMDSRIKPGDDGIYVKTIAAQTYITMDYQGRPVPTTIDRGAWMLGERYYDGTEQNDSGQYERSLVWYNGHGWLCNSGGVATADNIPAWNTTYWTHAVGDRMLHIEFNEVDSIVDLDNPECPLSVKSTYIGDDVTRSPSIYYDWTRKSHRNGAEDTASDALWNENHRNFGPSALLTAADMNFQFGAPPEKLVFTVTATLHDPDNPNLQPEEAQLFMI